MVTWTKVLAVSVFLFSLLSLSAPWVSASNEAVSLELTEAEEALVLAYDAVSGAERVGANVSDLLTRLNVGSEYLTEAYTSFLLEDSESVSHLAGLCVETADDVKNDAVLLRDETVKLNEADFSARVFISAAGVIIVLGGGFIFWGAFRRRYFKQVLELKPEVNNRES